MGPEPRLRGHGIISAVDCAKQEACIGESHSASGKGNPVKRGKTRLDCAEVHPTVRERAGPSYVSFHDHLSASLIRMVVADPRDAGRRRGHVVINAEGAADAHVATHSALGRA